ncbi:Glutamine--tRNA ligase [Pantoea agglomerans]|uniref:50S ribosomal protein L25 n=1 Tax=Enterobacter agglomerans TaxID=549 RepID=A0A379AJ05_ENTAG|nr:Glutamine--tRNA ligase [Pantoea agglomerans]
MKCRSAARSGIDRADFREEANKQYKRLVLGKEVRLRNAYVIRAERVAKDEAGNITCIYCTSDVDTLSKDPAEWPQSQRRDSLGFCGSRAAS